jgi:hypothetical protein
VDVYKKSDLKHKIARIDDYLVKPQLSGYRGVHLIYKYYSDRNNVYNDLKIELQLRSQLQHAWATAVETVGTFMGQALKSSMGEQDWLRFFTLMGTVIAFQEGTSPVANTPNDPKDLISEIWRYVKKLDVIAKLEAYGSTLQYIQQVQQQDTQFYLLELDPSAKSVRVTGYTKAKLGLAQQEYLEAEKAISEKSASEAVLVSVDSVASLQKAFPNYFLDTRVFIGLLQDALASKPLTIDEISIRPSIISPNNMK